MGKMIRKVTTVETEEILDAKEIGETDVEGEDEADDDEDGEEAETPVKKRVRK